jgi:hypothetical protein
MVLLHTTKVFHDLILALQPMKMRVVMPARIAGIQACMDASGNIRVNLDSSTPCRNDAIDGLLSEATEVSLPVFSRRLQSGRRIGIFGILNFVLFGLGGEVNCSGGAYLNPATGNAI